MISGYLGGSCRFSSRILCLALWYTWSMVWGKNPSLLPVYMDNQFQHYFWMFPSFPYWFTGPPRSSGYRLISELSPVYLLFCYLSLCHITMHLYWILISRSWFGFKRHPNKIVMIWILTLPLSSILPVLKFLSPLATVNCPQHYPNTYTLVFSFCSFLWIYQMLPLSNLDFAAKLYLH